jgi:hypothetical protein
MDGLAWEWRVRLPIWKTGVTGSTCKPMCLLTEAAQSLALQRPPFRLCGGFAHAVLANFLNLGNKFLAPRTFPVVPWDSTYAHSYQLRPFTLSCGTIFYDVFF